MLTCLQKKTSQPSAVEPLSTNGSSTGPALFQSDALPVSISPQQAGALPNGQAPFNNMQEAMNMLASGGDPEVMNHVSAKMGISPDQLQNTLQALQTGNMASVPQEVLEKAMTMQHAMRSNGMGMLGNMNAMAASASAMASKMAPPGAGFPLPPPQDENLGLLDEEEAQDWLVMYRGAYLRHVDIVFGPVFVFLISLLFNSGLLPLWVALWLVPMLLMICVRVVLVGFARIPPPLLQFSKLPTGMISALEVAAEATFILSMLPLLMDKILLCTVQITLTLAAYYFHYKSFRKDPGYIETGPPPPPVPPAELAAMQAANPYHCLTCGIYRPIRSKHCTSCGRCVSEFDHHCPIVGNCIGCGNRREFVGYLVTLFMGELLWIKLALVFWGRQIARASSGGPESEFTGGIFKIWTVASAIPGTAYMSLLLLAIFTLTLFLVGRQLFGLLGNMTTNEIICRRRYEHFKAPDGTFLNPFDQGPLTNCIVFWQEERPDWYEVYSKTREGGFKSVDWGVSKALKQADAWGVEKQRDREEWLLSRYGRVGGGASNGSQHAPSNDVEAQHECGHCQH